MNAEPLLAKVARHLRDLRFDVVLIGNAAAALQGAPVTTVDFDFMASIHGVRSFAGLRARAQTIEVGGASLLVASLSDIIKSKKAARHVKKRNVRRRALAAVRRESDRALIELIRRRLALPLHKRMNFLRTRVGFRGSAL